MVNTQAQVTLIQALLQARSEMPVIAFDSKNPHFKNRYASLASIVSAVTPVLYKHGLVIVQTTSISEQGMALNTILMHIGGEQLHSSYLLPDLADPQKVGSAITYARRYSLLSLLNLVGEDDDDANEASSVKITTDLSTKRKLA